MKSSQSISTGPLNEVLAHLMDDVNLGMLRCEDDLNKSILFKNKSKFYDIFLKEQNPINFWNIN